MKKLSHQQAGTLGELMALAKLNTLGFAAYMSPDGAPGHDLVVVTEGRPLSIEVKTRQYVDRPTEISRWPVDWETKGDADFFIFVELSIRDMSPTFYLLTNQQARSVHHVSSGKGNCYPAQVRKITSPNDFTSLGA